MVEGTEQFQESKRLVGNFLESRVPVEVGTMFEELKTELQEKGYPVKAVVPMMSLQGEWAIKELAGRKRGYGDIDWGVVIDCPSDREALVQKEISEYGRKYFEEKGQQPCTEINPERYCLNMQRLDQVAKTLGQSSRDYLRGEKSSYAEVVAASLPLIGGDEEMRKTYEERLKGLMSEEDFESAKQAMSMCVDWMRSVKKSDYIDSDTLNSLNLLRRIPHEIATTPEGQGSVRSFGLIAIKPGGMVQDVSEVVDYVLNSKSEVAEDDEVMNALTEKMSEEEKKFFLANRSRVKLRFTRFGDFSSSDSFWEASYEKRHSHKYWYGDLMSEVNKGTLDSFVVESDMNQKELERWLDLFKGKENIVQTQPDGSLKVIKQGKGIRGMYDSEAVMVDKYQLQQVEDDTNREIITEICQNMGEGGVLFVDLPEDVAPKVWQKLGSQEKARMLGNFVHMTGKEDEVWEGVKSLLAPDLGDSIIRRLDGFGGGTGVAAGILTDVYTFMKEGRKGPQQKMEELYPTDQTREKDNFAFGMFVVKPTGMDRDFPDLMKYLFDPRSRVDSNYEEIVDCISQTFDEGYRAEFRKVLDETSLDASFYGSFEPGEAPHFWEAHYLKKNGGKFYYRALLEGFKGGQTVETYLLRSTSPQAELDEWIKKVKGRETLIRSDEQTGEEQILYKGYGIRGLLDVEAIMFTEEKKQDLVSRIVDSGKKAQVEDYLRNVTLPIIYSRLPDEIQAIMWDSLPDSEQQAMISNFIHSPDDIDTVYEAVVELVKKDLSESEIEEVIRNSSGRKNVAIFDLVSGVLNKRLEKGKDAESGYQRKYPGNVRAEIAAVEDEAN